MKAGLFAVTALAVTTSAQSNSSTSLMTVYSYYNDCVTSASGLETVTNTATEKYCPECEDKGGPATASPDYNGPMTTYTTTFEQTCSTGLEEKTYVSSPYTNFHISNNTQARKTLSDISRTYLNVTC